MLNISVVAGCVGSWYQLESFPAQKLSYQTNSDICWALRLILKTSQMNMSEIFPQQKTIFISHFYPFCLIYSDFMSHFCGPSPNSLISAKEDGKPYLFIYSIYIYLFFYFRLVNSSKQNPDFCDLELVSSATGWLLPAAAGAGDGFQWSDPTGGQAFRNGQKRCCNRCGSTWGGLKWLVVEKNGIIGII